MGRIIMADHDLLIDRLANGLRPVRRVRPVRVRAMMFVPLAIMLGYLGTIFSHREAVDWSSSLAWMAVCNILLSFALGVATFVAALRYSLPDGKRRLEAWVFAAVAIWLGLAMISMAVSRNPVGAIGQGGYCFGFLMLTGLPMTGVALAALRQTRSIRPFGSLVRAALGVSFLSFGLLAFCHPFAMSLVDFAGHLSAAVLLGLLMMIGGRKFISA